jgi:hypothetical protein
MRRRTSRDSVVAVLMWFTTSALAGDVQIIEAPDEPYPTERVVEWVGLFNHEMVAHLEGGNKYRTLKWQSPPPENLDVIREELLTPRTWKISVRKKPDINSEEIGIIEITATPDDEVIPVSQLGLTATFHPAASGTPIPFVPDLFDRDWGYGPWFHQTALERKNHWFLLPKNPLPQPGWISTNDLGEEPHVVRVEVGTIYILDDRSITIVGSDPDAVLIRDEQHGDYFCGDDPPAIEPAEITRMPYKDLYNKDGHLRLKTKYTRGC